MQGLLRNHARIWIGVTLGVGVFFALPTGWLPVTRVLVAWDCGVTAFLGLLWMWMSGLSAEQICSRYIEEDESGPVILAVVVIAALASLVAIIQPLATLRHAEGGERTWHFVLAAACQTADIFTRRSNVRRVVLMHEVVSFLFNASILGFAINVTAGLIGG